VHLHPHHAQVDQLVTATAGLGPPCQLARLRGAMNIQIFTAHQLSTAGCGVRLLSLPRRSVKRAIALGARPALPSRESPRRCCWIRSTVPYHTWSRHQTHSPPEHRLAPRTARAGGPVPGWVAFRDWIRAALRGKLLRSRGGSFGRGDAVGLDRAPLAEGLGWTDSAVLCCLLLRLAIDLRTQEHDERGQKQPKK
jgi:hypothetical protein